MEQIVEGRAQQALFISRAGADADFAAVVGSILQAAGHSVILQQWDFNNRNFMERMHASLAEGARVVALLSPEYLSSEHCQAEWQNAIAADPLNTKGRLILLRVAECEPAGVLSGLAYWDLVPVRDNRALLEDIVRNAVREDRRDVVPSGPYWREPRTVVDSESVRPVFGFSGRARELAALDEALARDRAIVAVCGLGGTGKSSLAREYVRRNRERYAVAWWLNAQTEDAIVDGLVRLGALFVRGLDGHPDRRAAARQVTGSILQGFAKPVLLVFDNLEDERLLRAWLPAEGTRALVTSRDSAWTSDVSIVALQTWPLDTAVSYLLRESGRADFSEADARSIAEALGGLPLAMAHAAASLRGMRMVTPARYLERIGERLKSAPRTAEYPRSVFATFSAAIAQAEEQAAGAAAALRFAASFAPDGIPDELFRQPRELYVAGFPEGYQLDEALGALDRLSLLAFSDASRSYSLHRLVQLAALDMEVAGGADAWRESAVAVADAASPDATFESWPECARLMPHARAALENLSSSAASPRAGRLAHASGVYLRERGDYAGAEPLLTRGLAMRESALGADHPDVAASLNELGILLGAQGRYEEANRCYVRAQGILEKALGPGHRDVAISLNSLACSYYEQGRYYEAALLLSRALAIWEDTLGPEHSNVARALGNLAGVYYAQRRYDEAEQPARRALELTERALGPDHPHVAIYLNNVGELEYRRGRCDEAEQLLDRALAIWEGAALGPDHPDVAITLNVLGCVYEAQGRLSEAEAIHRRALAIREKALGPAHAAVATTLLGLANVRARQGEYDDAAALLARAVTIREEALGGGHDLTAEARAELRELSKKRQRAAET
jgi:tetratricopeptide (TPR) repeat protein